MAPLEFLQQIYGTAASILENIRNTVMTTTQPLPLTRIIKEAVTTTSTAIASTVAQTSSAVTAVTPTVTAPPPTTTSATECTCGTDKISAREALAYVFSWAGISDLLAEILLGLWCIVVFMAVFSLLGGVVYGLCRGNRKWQGMKTTDGVGEGAVYGVVGEEPWGAGRRGG